MPRVTQAHRDARRRQILDAARSRFARDGFHRTSVDDVIRAAGLSAGAVYSYFPSKTALVHAVVDDALDEVLRAFETARAATLGPAGPRAEPAEPAGPTQPAEPAAPAQPSAPTAPAASGEAAEPTGGVLPGPALVGAVVDTALREFARSGVDASRIALFAWAETLTDEVLRERVAARLSELRGRLRTLVTASPAPPGTATVPEALADDASLALLAAPVGAIVERHVLGGVDGGSLARGLSALTSAWAPSSSGIA